MKLTQSMDTAKAVLLAAVDWEFMTASEKAPYEASTCSASDAHPFTLSAQPSTELLLVMCCHRRSLTQSSI